MPGVPVPPGFIRPDPEPDPLLPTLSKSYTVTLNDGTPRSFATLNDYVNYYVAQGIVKNLDDLIQNYSHLLGEMFFQWVASGQLGCLFAAKLAKRPRENLWVPIIQLQALSEGDGLGPILNSHLDAASDGHEAAVVVFPDVNGAGEIVALVNALCSDPEGRWYRTEGELADDPKAAGKCIALRWILRSGESVNFVLGFANIETMPLTRRSPFTALFFRIKDAKRTPLHKEDGRVQVHLADLDSTYHPQELHDQIWQFTKEYRANHVEPDMAYAARAKVTFTVPRRDAADLCAVRPVVVEKEA